MTVRFRPALRDEVPAVVALLADDVLGRAREGADMDPYLAAFDAMQAQNGNMLVVGLLGDRIVACYQILFISGLSAAAARGGVRPDAVDHQQVADRCPPLL